MLRSRRLIYARRWMFVALAVLVAGMVGRTADAQVPRAAIAPATDSASDTSAVPEGTPTRIVVRAVSNDAKLLQDPVGGARIRIVETATGRVLAEGRQTGDSGSTEAIVRSPRERGASIYDTPGAAKFDTTLALDAPTRVTITALGPLAYPDAMERASTTLTLVPGQDVTGDGVVLTIHGFIVEALMPDEPAVAGETAQVRARVRMMCGCPTEPGGLWDASRYTIRVEAVSATNDVLATQPLAFTGTTSEYAADLQIPTGTSELRILAADPERGNFGVRTVPVRSSDRPEARGK